MKPKEKAAEKYAGDCVIRKKAFLAGVAWRDKHPKYYGVWKSKGGYQVEELRDKHPYLNEAKRICKEGKKKGGSRK